MSKISPEVLIYIQTIKNYLAKDEVSKQYFIGESDEDFFFKHLIEISQKNFESSGEAMLSREQFELLRKTLIAVIISKKDIPEDPIEKIFIDMGGFGKFCLN
jgi:hypothetical protein